MTEFKVPSLPLKVAKNETSKDVVKDKPDKTPSTEKEGSSLCPYKIPSWSGLPNQSIPYKFEVFKSGIILEEVKDLHKKAVWKFGRLPENDIEMAHPTISRFHAILQYRPSNVRNDDVEENEKCNVPEGWYIYDLGSTHGTFLNKQRIPARVYIRIRVGHMLKLGASTRWFLLQGPMEDEEPESELSVTEIKEKHQRDLEEAKLKEQEEIERLKNEGISWGMSEDAEEESDLSHNPYAATNNEELYLDDPKKTLRGYFEREGHQLEYKCDEMSVGSFICRVELPLDDANGRPIIAEVVHKGKKKECVLQCALEACRILDRHGVLRQANQEPQKRKHLQKKFDSDDDDDFWDRTGDIEKKRIRKASSTSNQTLTYNDLVIKVEEVNKQLQEIETSISNYQESKKKSQELKEKNEAKEDDLDNFMNSLNETPKEMDKAEIRRLHLDMQRLKLEQAKLERLVQIAKPTDIPGINSVFSQSTSKSKGVKKQLPMIGKRNQFSKFKVVKPVEKLIVSKPVCKELASDEEEMEDDEEEDNDKNNSNPTTDIAQEDNKKDFSKGVELNDDPVVKNKSENVVTPNDEIVNNTQLIDKTNIQETSTEGLDAAEEDIRDPAVPSNTKRKRSRQRARTLQREDMDFKQLEEHESSEKYSKWVPPENQSGDGFTSLNEKYGY